jgi:hypothetical protein
MPALNAQDWARVRAEWETGFYPTRALARRHNVSEKAIRKQVANRRDPWRRDLSAEQAARERAREATLRSLAAAQSASTVRIDPDVLRIQQEAVVQELAEAIAAANLEHLRLAAELRSIFETAGQLLLTILVGDEAAASAARRRVSGRGGVAPMLLALAKTAERIQVLEHRALGHDVKAAAVPARAIPASEPPPLPMIDVAQLSPGLLEALQPLLDLLDGRHQGEGP